MPEILGEYGLRPNNSNTHYVSGAMPSLLYTSFAPIGATTNQPRAERSGVSRGAPPWVTYRFNMVALKGRNKSRRVELSMFRPFRAAVSDQYRDPGRRHARKTRVALPWADMFGPFGAKTYVKQRGRSPGKWIGSVKPSPEGAK